MSRAQKLKRRYNITEQDYERLFVKQNGKCAICSKQTPGGLFKHFLVDHCHKTGQIRGLLCQKCNLGLGQFADNPEILTKAIQYLASKGAMVD